MPRKSSRIVAKKNSKACQDQPTIPNILQKNTRQNKRKAEEDLDRDMEINDRRRQFQIQNQWVPIEEGTSGITCSTIIPSTSTQHPTSETPAFQIGESFRFQNYFTTPVSLRDVPLPPIDWANPRTMWENMLRKELMYIRDPQVLSRHPQLQPKMRAILLDWIIEVCEVYRLHRESFFLCVDFIDRYLCQQRNTHKTQLQLIGITCLFVAAKIEEIYPPKLSEFAFVTDGACTENEILEQELIILKVLNWDLCPMTSNSWLNCYLQLANLGNLKDKESNFIMPHYSAHAFVQIVRLLDLCILDLGSLSYTYSLLATSALFHMASEHIALTVSGYTMLDIADCVQWMSPFAAVVKESGSVQLKFFTNIAHDETHNIQTHVVDLQLLEKAQEQQNDIIEMRSSPDFNQIKDNRGMLTPPQSNKKLELSIPIDNIMESAV